MNSESFKTLKSVSTVKFVLFLYCQGIKSHGLRNSSFSEIPGEKFPETTKNPGSARVHNVKYMEMVKDNLAEILELANRLSKDYVDTDGLKGNLSK